MNEAKHTPGPWCTHRCGFSSVYIEARVGGGMLQEVACCGPTNEGSDQQEANARLIAAAPELLDALRGLLALEEENLRGYDDIDVCAEVQFARAAIAKAAGVASSAAQAAKEK